MGKEIATAAQHAGYAAHAAAIGMAHAHLHHTINCLVGPQGTGFDAKELNPCNDFGNGAIPDTEDATKLKSLRAALGLAEEGLKSDDLDTAKTSGAQAAAEIKKLVVPRAADVGKEIATAAQHAGYAAHAAAIGMAHAHLHHTINCLVGPQGAGFDAKELNPCNDFGNGAIPDTEDATKLKSSEPHSAWLKRG